MTESNVEKYLMEGIHGKKELNADEKRKYLGALRERIILVLTKSQVRRKNIPHQVKEAMKSYPEAKLLLNGNMDYSFLSKYIKLSEGENFPYTMVTDQEHDTDIGLVLVHSEAIDKEQIYIQDNMPKINYTKQKEKKGLFSFFSKS